MDEDRITIGQNNSEVSKSDTISREAMGRIARLGDLYDATTDKFCAVSMFREHLPHGSPAISCIDNPHSKVSASISSSLKEKLDMLDVTADLKLSILAGMVDLKGAAKYLEKKKTSFKSVECALVCNTTAAVDQLDLFSDEVKSRVSDDALRHPKATHVVVQIYWGANCTVRVTDQNSEDEKKKTVEGNIMAKIDKLKTIISSSSAEVRGGLTEEEREGWKKLSVEMFGDVLPDTTEQFPTTLEEAMEMVRNLPQLIRKSNDGKGKPLTYVMFPLSSPAFDNYPGVNCLMNQAHRKVDEGRIVRVIRIFDKLSELTQKAHDHLDEINNHSHCVTDSELEDASSILEILEVQEASLSGYLETVLEAVRSGQNDAESLAAFCSQHYTTAKETFQKFKKIFDAIRPRIEFAKRCERFGAKYLIPPADEQIRSTCDDYENVYVLFDGEADCQTAQKNHLAFIELVKNNQDKSRIAFRVVWLDQHQHVRIEHYRKGKLLYEDVAKELETKDMAECIQTERPTFHLTAFKARCPGSFDGDCSRDERSWTCFKCSETLQLCRDSSLGCRCGKAKANEFRFRCRSEFHGSHFIQFSDEILQRIVGLQIYNPSICKGNYSIR